jgi:hypothetical protein
MKIDYLISGIVGLITGIIGTLIAPWVNWKIEQKKDNRNNKIQLINNIRLYLENNEPRESIFLNSPDYIKIRPFLSEDLINELESLNKTIISTSIRSIYKSKLLNELDYIEELWGIDLSIKNRKNNISYNINKGLIITVEEEDQ